MKYIRAKDGIFLVAKFKYDYQWDNAVVINQADTIEELCDEFVVIHKKQHTIFTYISIVRNVQKESDEPIDAIYGAIWTDKGLVYVAKMNDKGELELL